MYIEYMQFDPKITLVSIIETLIPGEAYITASREIKRNGVHVFPATSVKSL